MHSVRVLQIRTGHGVHVLLRLHAQLVSGVYTQCAGTTLMNMHYTFTYVRSIVPSLRVQRSDLSRALDVTPQEPHVPNF